MSITQTAFSDNQKSIELGTAPLHVIARALEEAGKDRVGLNAVRESARLYLETRIRTLMQMSRDPSISDGTQNFFREGAGRLRESLDTLMRGRDAFIPSGINSATGITIPATVEKNRDEVIYGHDERMD